jgi:hypothetical protein
MKPRNTCGQSRYIGVLSVFLFAAAIFGFASEVSSTKAAPSAGAPAGGTIIASSTQTATATGSPTNTGTATRTPTYTPTYSPTRTNSPTNTTSPTTTWTRVVLPYCWQVVPSPSFEGAINVLHSVAVVASNDAWAVGWWYGGPNVGAGALVLHWDGSTWQRMPVLDEPGSFLYSVVAISSNDVWAVGNRSYNTLTMHWNGVQWSIVPSPNGWTGGTTYTQFRRQAQTRYGQ